MTFASCTGTLRSRALELPAGLGPATARRDHPARMLAHAESPYREALTLTNDLGMRPLVAH